ncbi:MAG: hypothetical protein IAI49_01405, partial [Candidatus Eremiobacteraeota bacterium]|nr:hypothetical protein [Candidatus Eremiobacteraeota bacterium]
MLERQASVLTTLDSFERVALETDVASGLAARAVFSSRVRVGSAVVETRFSQQAARDIYSLRFADALTGEPATLVCYAVPDERATYFWTAGDEARCWPAPLPASSVAFFADAATFTAHFTSSSAVSLHAASVAGTHRTAALVGSSTAGKTTT